MEEFKLHSVEKVIEVSQKQNVKILYLSKTKHAIKGTVNIKNITGQVLTYKEFSLTKQKLDLERTTSDLEKPFLKNQIKTKKNKINVKMPHVDKKNH